MLSPRLAFLLSHCLPDQPVWDFFCDHGYLGEEALRSGRFSAVSFVDQIPEIIRSLKARLEDADCDLEHAFFHATDALTLDWSMVNGNIVMAGIGGELMAKVLARALGLASVLIQGRQGILSLDGQSDRDKLPLRRFILCPNGDFELVEKVAQSVNSSRLQSHAFQERGRPRDVLVLS